MKIKLLYFGALAEEMGSAGSEVDVEKGIYSSQLLKAVSDIDPRLINWQDRLLMAINCEHVGKSNIQLVENDEVALMPPLSGG